MTPADDRSLDAGAPPPLDAADAARARAAHEAWRRDGAASGPGPGPRVVPWDDLTDAERAYARRLVAAGRTDDETTADDDDRWTTLADSFRDLDLETLLGHWRARDQHGDAWASCPRLYHRLAKQLTRLGHLLLAREVATEGLAHARHPRHARWAAWLRHALGVALVRSGAPRRAHDAVAVLRPDDLVEIDPAERPNLYVEVRSLLGRAHKDLGLAATNEADRRAELERALTAYREAATPDAPYASGAPDSFPAVNAAAVALWLGRVDEARTLAALAWSRAEAENARDEAGFWPAATLGECALIEGRLDAAERWYGEATARAGNAAGDVASMRRQARLHARHLGVPIATIDAWIRVPPVIVFSGHMVDDARRARTSPRLPLSAMPVVATAIAERLARHGAAYGFASAAAGSDLLFLEAMRARRAETHLLLPFARELFAAESVVKAPGDWLARFDAMTAHADRNGLLDVLAGTPRAAGGLAFEYANLVLLGLALLKARELETDVVGLAVWNGAPGQQGGTEDAVRAWERHAAANASHAAHGAPRLYVDTITPPRIAHDAAAEEVAGAGDAAGASDAGAGDALSDEIRHRIGGVLFADVVNFSAISENAVLPFFEAFLREVGRLIVDSPVPPLVRNTWGDGLFLVFSRVSYAGEFALRLCKAMEQVDWEALGLPKLVVRVSLHAGPLFEFVDRVTGHLTLSGRHVTQAARIEPVTPPGLVYASREFAALAAAFDVREFVCDPVGVVPLAKSAGHKPLYVLRATPDAGRT